MAGTFISMEGGDGAGKTLQCTRLYEALCGLHFPVLYVREPGGTLISEQIRNITIDEHNTVMHPVTEALLYASARAQLVHEVIHPALAAGKIVICDRFIDSTVAYQVYGRGLSYDDVLRVNLYATGGLLPTLTFFLDIAPEVSIRRKQHETSLDRIEMETKEFHEKVYNGYKILAKENPNRIIRVDAEQDPDTVFLQIFESCKKILSK